MFFRSRTVAAFCTHSVGGYNWRPGHERNSLGHHLWAKGARERKCWMGPGHPACLSVLALRDRFLLQSIGLSRIQTTSLTQGVPKGRISKIIIILVLSSQLLLHFHTTWKHVYLIFPTLAKSLRMFISDWIILSSKLSPGFPSRDGPELLS